jgi:hypothetical protein
MKLFCSAWQRFTHQHLGLAATFTGLPPVQVLQSAMSPDDFFAHNKAENVILTTFALQHCVHDLP